MRMVREQEERTRFGHFIDTLSDGWEIEEPVLLGAMATTNAYHFVLRKRAEDRTRLVSLRPSPELLVFLSENNLAIQAI
ncbi:MAG TPA: hypothetical protein PKE64_14545 [Anaerolineae bacterium]|nr:hypothetical protein [Anaerolineae bacterium]HMR65222.1 hypothetical protein [Anaerolineae bacterium]